MFRPFEVWILKCQDTRQSSIRQNVLCLSVAEALGVNPKIMTITPRWPFGWLPALASRFCPPQKSPLLSPPWPDMIFVSDLATIPYARAVKAQARDMCFICSAVDPMAHYREFDLIWAHERDNAPALPNIKTIPIEPIGLADQIAKDLLERYNHFVCSPADGLDFDDGFAERDAV